MITILATKKIPKKPLGLNVKAREIVTQIHLVYLQCNQLKVA
jgi:hypothetical protein